MKNYLTANISASAVKHNMAVLREALAPGVKICPVVKDDCYGHGLDLLYPILAERVDGFAVASPSEALGLRERGWRGFVLCFLSAYSDELDVQRELVEQGITQTVMSVNALASIQAAAERAGKGAQVHLKVDTGMGRMGVPAGQAPALMEAIRAAKGVALTGIYTHFATADEADRKDLFTQLDCFRSILPAAGNIVRHAANSAAAIDLPQTHFDMIRPGIAVYGCQPSRELVHLTDLRPCLSVAAKLIAVKHVPKDSRCGYGLTHRYERNSRVGIVPIGYGDGYFRCLSNQAVVRVRGHNAPVCGRVSMDQMTVDLTDIPDAQVGDVVEVISADPKAPNSAENLARMAGTIPYEITCHLGHSIRNHVLVD